MLWLTQFWWVTLPRFVRRVAITPALALTDGIYVAAFPAVSAFLSPLLLLLGFLFGSLSIGYDRVFSESLFLLLLTVFLGILSGHLGLMFLIGFAVGDYFLFEPKWIYEGNIFLHFLYRFARVIQYGVLAMLLVQTPLLTKVLIGQFYEIMRLGRVIGVMFAFISHIFLSVVLVFLWAQAVPVLIRPLYTWTGQQPIIQAVKILQDGFLPLLVVAAVASVARMILQSVVAFSPVFSDRITAIETAVNQDSNKPLSERIPLIPAVLAAAWGALLLSGLYSNVLDAIVVGIVLLILQLLRRGTIPLPLGGWAWLMGRIPLIIRLAVMVGILYGLGYVILSLYWENAGDTFRPMLIVTVISLILFYFLNPKSSATDNAEKQQTG